MHPPIHQVLEDDAALRRGDPSGMLAAFAATGEQLVRGYEAAGAASGLPRAAELRSVVFCGMGGSAAGAEIACAAVAAELRVPVVVVRGYAPPAWCGDSDLVVCVSYSGNTEETVSALAEARSRGCPTVAVAGGGRLLEDAPGAAVRIPAEAPVPRAGLGVLVGGVLGTLAGVGLVPEADGAVAEARETLDELARSLAPASPPRRNEAKQVASWVGDRIPVVWGSDGVSAAAAWRWKTSFNENAEIPAFAGVLPELDHHEVVGWNGERGHGFRLVVLREPGEHGRVRPRLEATLDEIAGSGLEWREVHARGEGPLSRCLSLTLVGDLAGSYHALARGVDPAAMAVLDRIKQRLRGDGR